MLLREVGYARPTSVEEALGLLGENAGSRPLAGGQTLLNVMKARIASPEALIDLNGIDDLKGIELGADGSLEIGAMTTTTDVVESAEARARPILGEVCAQIADVQVRNRGTVLLLGLCTRPDPINSFAMLSKEARLVTSAFFTVPEYQASLDALTAGAVEPRLLVTDTITLENTPAVFESLKHRTSQCKVLIAP